MTRTIQEVGFLKFVAGDIEDPHCPSVGGTLRRTYPGNDFFPALPDEEFKIHFDGIEGVNPDTAIELPLGLVSADAPDRCMWCSTMKGGANHFCTDCSVHR